MLLYITFRYDDHFYFSPFLISLFYPFSETPSICFLSRNLCSLVIIKLFCYIITAPIFLQCICSTVISHHLLVNYQKSKKYAFMLVFCLFVQLIQRLLLFTNSNILPDHQILSHFLHSLHGNKYPFYISQKGS